MQLGNHADHKEMEIEVQVDIVLLRISMVQVNDRYLILTAHS
jgi:hypothetical protein